MFALTFFGSSCYSAEQPAVQNGTLNGKGRLLSATLVGDSLILLTALVVCILGALSIAHGIPEEGLKALYISGGVIGLSWVGMFLFIRSPLVIFAKNLLHAAVCKSEDHEIRAN